MRAFLTGGTGFIGGRLAARLRERGDEVAALVRSPERADRLSALGCELVRGDLADEESIRKGVLGCHATFHAAAAYRVGIPSSERPAMYDANVRGTERVIDAASEAGVERIVYVSTIGAFGNTGGRIVDETYSHPGSGYRSYYEETKVLAHRAAEERIARGAPVIVVMPGGVYGPGDSSDLGRLIDRVRRGRLPGRMYPDTGFNWVHVEDVVDGILLAHDRGRVGERYVLGGHVGTMGDMIDAVAAASGRRAPRWRWPSPLIKAGIPFGRLLGPMLGLGPNLRELIAAADGVTYWASHEKAERELGYRPRDLRTGVGETVKALPAA
ncbi:MAG: NAD-dependent epimerase/dehydratase family protein [Actinomycetota bacterium]